VEGPVQNKLKKEIKNDAITKLVCFTKLFKKEIKNCLFFKEKNCLLKSQFNTHLFLEH